MAGTRGDSAIKEGNVAWRGKSTKASVLRDLPRIFEAEQVYEITNISCLGVLLSHVYPKYSIYLDTLLGSVIDQYKRGD